MRLIDADALKCAIKWNGVIATITKEIIDEQPTVDAVQVVRCRDCEHWGTKKTVGGYAKCSLDAAWHGPEFYCANGVKRA